MHPNSCTTKLEVFIEHIPRAERLQAKMHAVQLHLCRCASNRAAIAYTVFVYGHIQGVGVTAYRIYYCEAGEVGPNVTNNMK